MWQRRVRIVDQPARDVRIYVRGLLVKIVLVEGGEDGEVLGGRLFSVQENSITLSDGHIEIGYVPLLGVSAIDLNDGLVDSVSMDV